MANPNIVSVSSIYGESCGWALTNTLTTTLFTVSAEKLIKINRIVCANVDGTNAADLNLYITTSIQTSLGGTVASGATGILIPKYGNIFCYHDGTDIRSSGMISTRGSAGTRAAQAAYTLPAADGSANQLLQTDGSGSVSFATVSSGITMGKAIAAAMIFG